VAEGDTVDVLPINDATWEVEGLRLHGRPGGEPRGVIREGGRLSRKTEQTYPGGGLPRARSAAPAARHQG